jgi:hypothetical protein
LTTDWVPLWTGVAGGLFGASGAVGASLVSAWRERKARVDERKFQRTDRLLAQGTTAAREALAITSPFFTRTPAKGEYFRALTPDEWAEVRRIDDLAELIDNEDARVALRAAVAAIGGASLVELALAEVNDNHEPHGVYHRERRLLRLVRDALGAYLRDEPEALASLRRTATGEEDAVHSSEAMLGLED